MINICKYVKLKKATLITEASEGSVVGYDFEGDFFFN